MGDLISIADYKKKKEIREAVYGSHCEWVARRFLNNSNFAANKYDLAVDRQQEGEFYLYKYFFPDYDW